MSIERVNRFCPRCGRQRQRVLEGENHDACKLELQGGSVYYVHDSYGCDTGCCGHRIVTEDANGKTIGSDFEFIHDKEALDETVQGLANEYTLTIGECQFSDD